MEQHVYSISGLIDAWPTIGQFAKDVGCGYEAARQMRRRGKIAPKHWQSIVVASNKRGIEEISLEWLARQHALSIERAA